MTQQEMYSLVYRSKVASLGYTDEDGRQNIRMVFCTFHKGIGMHLISTNTSSSHVQSLLKNENACLYFSDPAKFEALCLSGRAVVHFDREYKELIWHPQDIQYYPGGVEDEDYCVIEFIADSGRFYNGNSDNYKGDIMRQDIEAMTAGRTFAEYGEEGMRD